MKRTTQQLFVWLLAIAAPLPASASSAVERVVVYPQGAEVTRRRVASCASGATEVVFAELPRGLDPRTLRAVATGPGEVLGLAAAVVELAGSATTSPEIAAARTKLAELSDRRATRVERRKNAASFEQLAARLLATSLRDPKSKPDEWRRTLDALATERVSGAREDAQLANEERRAQQRLEALERAHRPQPRRPVHEARVTVGCREAGPVEVHLAYVIGGARWAPEYDLRFHPEQGGAASGPGRFELTVAASVTQATGEDWTGAELVLSTARLDGGARAPEVAPLWVQGNPANREKVLVAKAEDRQSLAGAGQATKADPSDATLGDAGTAVTLKVPGRVTVRADGRRHWFPVDRLAGRGEARLVAVPSRSTDVYQVLLADNPAPYPLLPGRLTLFRGESHGGHAVLGRTAPGERMELSLGLLGGLTVERIDVRALANEPSFLSSQRKLIRELEVRVWNRSGRSERVEIREQLPVSIDERIEVVLDAAKTTRGFERDLLQGHLKWTIAVGPSARGDVRFAYTVKLPDDWQFR